MMDASEERALFTDTAESYFALRRPRPAMLPQTGELNRIEAQAEALVDAYHASAEIPIAGKAGLVVHCPIDGRPATFSARCECPAEDCRLYNDPHAGDKAGERTVTLICANHGPSSHIAILNREREYSRQVFGWAEKQHEKDRRVSWGMSRRTTL